MSKQKDNTDTYINEDGSRIDVNAYTNQEGSYAIVVHEYDKEGHEVGHVTNPSENPSVHVTDENGKQDWEAGYNPENGESNPTPYNYENEDGSIETVLLYPSTEDESSNEDVTDNDDEK